MAKARNSSRCHNSAKTRTSARTNARNKRR